MGFIVGLVSFEHAVEPRENSVSAVIGVENDGTVECVYVSKRKKLKRGGRIRTYTPYAFETVRI